MYHPDELAIYIHWPFCKSKCPYCDFYKKVDKNVNQDDMINEYIDSLNYYHSLTSDRNIKSIFFGGGTPSLIEPKYIEKIINFIATKWHCNSDIEISLEANPNSNHKNMFVDLKSAGINRLSLGVQALNENDLRFLGRTHNLQMARDCLNEIVSVFDNHSADLIYARPEQNIAIWEKELEEITSYGLKHISLYQLTIEEGTVFAKKNIKTLNDDIASEMYDYTQDYLHSKNYIMYEVSNFAQDGFCSKHNLTYWQGGDYIGIGESAHGRLFLNNNHYAIEYPQKFEKLSSNERAEELIIMGLRLTRGLDKNLFNKITGIEFTKFVNHSNYEFLKSANFIAEKDDYIYATSKGFKVLNKIIEELCC